MKFLFNWSMLLLSNRDGDNIKQKVVLDSNEGLFVFGKLMLQVLCLDTDCSHFQSKLAETLQSNIIMELLVSFLAFRFKRFD